MPIKPSLDLALRLADGEGGEDADLPDVLVHVLMSANERIGIEEDDVEDGHV